MMCRIDIILARLQLFLTFDALAIQAITPPVICWARRFSRAI
jgi:hypothetical protein